MNNLGFKSFPNYILHVNEKIYTELDSYKLLLDGVSRLSNQSIYLIDFYRGDVLYSSVNPLFLSKSELENISLLKNRFDIASNLIDESSQISIFVKSWFDFIESKPIEDKRNYTLQFDYHIEVRLVGVSMTPVFLSLEGKPWIILCSSKISTNSSFGNVLISRNNSRDIWHFSIITKRWIKGELLSLTEIEQKVLRLSIQGKTETEICNEIFRSINGLKSLKRRIFRKMEVNNITEAVSFAISHGLI